ncbi:MAG: hypothetical protein AAGU02_02615 [Lawsonibacter sp.]
MKLIEIAPLMSGAHRNYTIDLDVPTPEGWAVIPDDMIVPSSFPFVDITVADGSVTSIVAREAPAPAHENDPEPTLEDLTLDLLAEHEERLCMLEILVT